MGKEYKLYETLLSKKHLSDVKADYTILVFWDVDCGHCQKEIPYSTQIEIEEFKEEEGITRIRAHIIVERDSQKGIIIGKGGEMLQRIGRAARQDMEKFLDKKVFLENFVKVDKDWRTSADKLKKYGY